MKFSYSIFIFLFFLHGCGTAQTIYADSKYKFCEDSCRLKYSKYNYQKINECLRHCQENKNEDID